MAVKYIGDDGYMTLMNMNGVDKKTLPGSQILFLTDEKLISGVILSQPIHLQYAEKTQEDVDDWNDVRATIGANSKDYVLKNGINIGTPVIFQRNVNLEFGENKLVGNALDDKAGIFCTYQLLKNLAENPLPKNILENYTIIGLATTGEESGLRGATVAAKNINPNLSIDLDVIHANCGLFKPEKYGDLKLGNGPVIEFGPDKSRKLNGKLMKLAEENNIKYQIEIGIAGGTNTDQIQLMSADCETTLISLPLLSMHTQNETMDWNDIENTVKLLEAFIRNLPNSYM